MISRYDSVIVATVCKKMIPFMQLYALYVIMHGHYSPGGGFQGGVILGASFILMVIALDIEEANRRMKEKFLAIFMSLGVFIYGGIGTLALIFGGNYLDYGKLPLPVKHHEEIRALGILGIEIGVGITVMAIMLKIFLELSTYEEEDYNA